MRGISWKGHLLLPNRFPRGARLDTKSAASNTAVLWPAFSPSSKLHPHRPDLDITAVEKSDAVEYYTGVKTPPAKGNPNPPGVE